MSPKVKSENSKTRSRQKSLPKHKKSLSKTSSPIKTRSRQQAEPKTPKNKKSVESIPSASFSSDPGSTSIEENKVSKKDDLLITPKVMKYCLNAYKHSPDYDDLRKKRFNTGFRYESPRGTRDIEIFTPDEEDSSNRKVNLRSAKNKSRGEPGEQYADIFMSIPGISDSDDNDDNDAKEVKVEETKTKSSTGKKGKKKSIGYQGIPLPDECLLTDYTSLLYSPG